MKEYKIIIKGVQYNVSKEIHELFCQDRERERYYNNKKREKVMIDQTTCKVTFKESVIDSLDRLKERNVQIADKSRSVEDYITTKVDLKRALGKLTIKERYIIEQYYFNGRTENEIAQDLNMKRVTLYKNKKLILYKLHNLLKE